MVARFKRIRDLSRRVIRDTELADDVASEVFLWFIEHKDAKPYRRMVVWRILDKVKKIQGREVSMKNLPDKPSEVSSLDLEDLDSLDDILDGLPEEDGILLYLTFWKGLDASEVSIIVGRSFRGVQQKLRDVLERLRDRAKELGLFTKET